MTEDALGVLSALLIAIVVIVGLYEVARRFGVPYPSLFVIGGAALGFLPGIPQIAIEPDIVLLVFLPPLLFGAAFETPLRDLRANLGPIARLAFGLVIVTAIAVAGLVEALMPGLGWPAALTLGAIVAPTDALAATTVFRRLGVPRTVVTIVEGEALFNDATALILYRSAVVATLAGGFLLAGAVSDFIVATVGGIVFGYVVGRVAAEILRVLDDPPVEVVISLIVPFIAYLPAEELGLSGVLAVVTAGLVIGRRLATILSPGSRVMWLTTWKIVAFVLNGLAFILVGQALPGVIEGLDSVSPARRPRARARGRRGDDRDPVHLGVPLEPAAELAAPDAREARPRDGLASRGARGVERAAWRGLARGRAGPAGHLPRA